MLCKWVKLPSLAQKWYQKRNTRGSMLPSAGGGRSEKTMTDHIFQIGLKLRGEWPSCPASSISSTEVTEKAIQSKLLKTVQSGFCRAFRARSKHSIIQAHPEWQYRGCLGGWAPSSAQKLFKISMHCQCIHNFHLHCCCCCLYFSRLLYLAFSANLGLLCMPHPNMELLV